MQLMQVRSIGMRIIGSGIRIRISAVALAQIQEKRGEQLLAGLANLVLEQAKHTTEEMGS
jgi:hypothetical protein